MNLDPKKTIYLIDGSSILYRGYYGLRPLHTSKGVPVQAVYNFCRMIKKMIDSFSPIYIAVVWDSKGKTTRHEMFEDYKATRQEPPSDLFEQKEKIVEFTNLIGIKQVQQQGIEADDLMYSIARDRAQAGDTVVLITSDKDMGQALSDKICMFDSFKDQLITKESFEEKMGFPVSKIPFYFALLGDVSDNIPGVRGVGKKGAIELIQKFDSLDDLYNRLDEVEKKRTHSALADQKDNAFLSRDLFLLQYYPSNLEKEDFAFDAINWKNAKPVFVQCEFKSLLKDLGITKQERIASAQEKIEHLKKYNFITVTTQEQLDALCRELQRSKVFAMDTETNGVRTLECDLVGLSFCTKKDEAYYVPCGHIIDEPHLSLSEVIKTLKPILQDPTIEKYLHNTKFDQLVLYNHGIELQGVAFDSLVAANLVTEDWQRVSLKKLSVYYFDEQMLTFEDVVKANKYKDFSYVPLELATYYSAMDSLQTYRLTKLLEKELKKQEVDSIYYEIEFPLTQILYCMEREGIYIDAAFLTDLDKAVSKALEVIENEILVCVGKEKEMINLNSPQQIEQLLFNELQLTPIKKSATGRYSTDHEVLVQLAKQHPVPAFIVKYRELSKLKNTYIDALPNYINPHTKRVHTTFSQTQTATGRLASSSPNLQNIPADASGYGIMVRQAFKPKEGNVYISADYSQIELRVLAFLSQDKNLINAFMAGHDIHAQTAAGLFEMPLKDVAHDQRQIGKRINFSILYGLTPFGLSKDLGIPLADARQYIEKYFAQYPKVSEWMEGVIDFVKKNGYVKTLWGRRRYIPAIYEKNRTLYDEARRVAINTVAQGTAAEIMKKGMIDLHGVFMQQNCDAQMLLQIHDELLITVNETQKDAVQKVIKSTLESVVDWDIPLEVVTRIGANWKEVTK